MLLLREGNKQNKYNDNRYLIYGEEAVEYDPFGYYSPRLVSEKRPSTYMPYYMDYPVTDTQWIINDEFSAEDKKSD